VFTGEIDKFGVRFVIPIAYHRLEQSQVKYRIFSQKDVNPCPITTYGGKISTLVTGEIFHNVGHERKIKNIEKMFGFRLTRFYLTKT